MGLNGTVGAVFVKINCSRVVSQKMTPRTTVPGGVGVGGGGRTLPMPPRRLCYALRARTACVSALGSRIACVHAPPSGCNHVAYTAPSKPGHAATSPTPLLPHPDAPPCRPRPHPTPGHAVPLLSCSDTLYSLSPMSRPSLHVTSINCMHASHAWEGTRFLPSLYGRP